MHTSNNAKHKLTIVFGVIPSLKWNPINIVYVIIPIPNPINLAGHNIPFTPATVYLVPQI
tara:strand:+ start:321 stop:500 length:180 start_codon:yes stop_codon:yes gene_type:complete